MDTMSDSTATQQHCNDGPILHVVVVGFHHKRGCQVEYSYPSLIPGEPVDSQEVPEEWKHLPSLALPDGAHNYEEDTIYFHLPARGNSKQTVYGISCYRQMDSESLINRSSDVTRGSVQKSVCVISTLPLYGLIQAKLALITHAYFEEKDFSQVSLLQETYRNLSQSLNQALVTGSQVFLGLSVREFVLIFRHKALLLFKLILLERKVLFCKSPVSELCSTILTLLSLFPGMIEQGMKEAAVINNGRKYCSDMKLNQENDFVEVQYKKSLINEEVPLKNNQSDFVSENLNAGIHKSNLAKNQNNSANTVNLKKKEKTVIINDLDTVDKSPPFDDCSMLNELESMLDKDSKEKVDLTKSKLQFCTGDDDLNSEEDNSEIDDQQTSRITSLRHRLSGAFQTLTGSFTNEDGENSTDTNAEPQSPSSLNSLHLDDCGLPLSVFTKGALCLPYLSLPYLDLLSDVNVRSFVFGATNVLFKQKKHLLDAIIEIDEGKVEILDPELKKQLNLTMEDLRFADFLVRHVVGANDGEEDVFLDGTGWEGGDEWLRAQFKWYLLSLLRSSQLEDGNKECESFNTSFITAWKTTHNYKMWLSGSHTGILEINPGHPFHGNISMADMKLRLSHTMLSSERGRKINQAVSSTGRYVTQTGRVVGGALTNARSTVSSWFSNFAAAQQTE